MFYWVYQPLKMKTDGDDDGTFEIPEVRTQTLSGNLMHFNEVFSVQIEYNVQEC